jgi:predicted transcriptional regulator
LTARTIRIGFFDGRGNTVPHIETRRIANLIFRCLTHFIHIPLFSRRIALLLQLKDIAMTAVQLNAKKLEIISLLMNTDDEKKVTKILNLARDEGKDDDFEPVPGLAYTREERIAEIDQAVEDYHAGRFIPHEEVFKPYRQWL